MKTNSCHLIYLFLDLEDECSSTCNSDPINEENEYGYEMSNGKVDKTTCLAS